MITYNTFAYRENNVRINHFPGRKKHCFEKIFIKARNTLTQVSEV